MADRWIREARDYWPSRPWYRGAVLIRFALWPLRAAFDFSPFRPYERAPFATWPVRVLYGGPIPDAGVLQSDMGQAWLEAMRAWLATNGYAAWWELVPLAPANMGNVWPHREFRWWYATEYQPRERYRVAFVNGIADHWELV